MSEKIDPFIEGTLEAMRMRKAKHDFHWSLWFNQQPARHCTVHPEVQRSVDVERSQAVSWTRNEMVAIHRKCYKCVGEQIQKKKAKQR